MIEILTASRLVDLLPVSNLGSDFKSTYLRAPKELYDKITDSERSPRVYFLVSILSKNIYGARRKSILKFTSFELKEPTFKTGIAFAEILDPCFVPIPVRVADSKLLCADYRAAGGEELRVLILQTLYNRKHVNPASVCVRHHTQLCG